MHVSSGISSLRQHQQTEYHTTPHRVTDVIHRLGKILTKPLSWNITNGAKIACYSNPGGPKNKWKDLTKNVLRAVVLVVTIIPAAGLAAVGFPLRLIGSAFRDNMTLLQGTAPAKEYKPENGLHYATYNVGLVPPLFDAILDTRPSCDRAQGIARAINEMPNEHQPDMICFQEIFDNDAAGILFEGLKHTYYHTLHSIMPSEMGVGSGAAFVSKYPILSASFRRFDNLTDEDGLTKQGLLRVVLDLGGGKTSVVYNTHLQSGHSEKCHKARHDELTQIRQWIREDGETDSPIKTREATIFMGDLNVYRFSELQEPSNEYEEAKEELGDKFVNLFEVDHNENAQRNQGEAWFTSRTLPEPDGSFHFGAQNETLKGSLWAKTGWSQTQEVCHRCIEDYGCLIDPKLYAEGSLAERAKKYQVHSEVRQLVNHYAPDEALSDHLMVSFVLKVADSQSEKMEVSPLIERVAQQTFRR